MADAQKDRFAPLVDAVRRLHGLLQNPEPGLMSYRSAVCSVLGQVVQSARDLNALPPEPDTTRLDWLEANAYCLSDMGTEDATTKWEVFPNDVDFGDPDHVLPSGFTARAAIDAARGTP